MDREKIGLLIKAIEKAKSESNDFGLDNIKVSLEVTDMILECLRELRGMETILNYITKWNYITKR